jgi:enoyl-CoA hydratase/carnithine racemase
MKSSSRNIFFNPEYYQLSFEGPIVTLKMQRQGDPYNMIDAEFGRSLRRTFTELDADPDSKVLILTGTDPVFTTGADIVKEFPRLDAHQARMMAADGHHTLIVLEDIGLFSIAAINGFCLAGGLELAMACSYRIASNRARIGQTEVQVGVIPGWGGSQRLPRLVGKSKALKMILTGEILTAEDACKLGIVDEVVPHKDLMTRALALATQVAKNNRELIRLAKRSVDLGTHVPLWYALGMETEYFQSAWNLPDRKDLLEKFLARRNPPQ